MGNNLNIVNKTTAWGASVKIVIVKLLRNSGRNVTENKSVVQLDTASKKATSDDRLPS